MIDDFSACWNNDVGIRDRLQSRRHGRASTIFRCGPFEPFVYEFFHFSLFFFLRERTAINAYILDLEHTLNQRRSCENRTRDLRVFITAVDRGTRNQRNQRYFDACACMEFFYLPRSRRYYRSSAFADESEINKKAEYNFDTWGATKDFGKYILRVIKFYRYYLYFYQYFWICSTINHRSCF